MKNLIFLILFGISTSTVFAQTKKTWLLGEKELQYVLPHDWSSDPYYGLRNYNSDALLLSNEKWDTEDQMFLAVHPNSQKINSILGNDIVDEHKDERIKIDNKKFDVYSSSATNEYQDLMMIRKFVSVNQKNHLTVVFATYRLNSFEEDIECIKETIKSLTFKKANIPLKKKWWFVDDDALTYQVPNDWRVDPFITSSVCDCWGSIIDNGEWDDDYVGIVIYPSSQKAQLYENRNEVWDYEFVPNGKERKVSFAGINYLLEEGNMVDDDDNEIAWKLSSLNTLGDKKAYLTIHFWTKGQKQFDKNISVFEEILSTVQLKDLKYDFE